MQVDPDNVGYQRALSVSYDRLGYLELDAGRPVDAARCFQRCRVIAERLVELDPGNTQYQQELRTSYDKLRDLFGELPDHERQ